MIEFRCTVQEMQIIMKKYKKSILNSVDIGMLNFGFWIMLPQKHYLCLSPKAQQSKEKNVAKLHKRLINAIVKFTQGVAEKGPSHHWKWHWQYDNFLTGELKRISW